jgi:glycosyltransferase involved in cell wall biosynthesis
MPVWNGEAFIREGIDSILAQTFRDFELIISDNASTDSTQAICEEYSARDPRIRYVRADRNLGLQANFALVLELATAPYFMWAAHDDLWDVTYVSRMVDVLDERQAVVIAGSNAASVDQDGVVRRTYDNAWIYAPRSIGARAHRFISAHEEGGHSTLIYGLMRTPTIRRFGLMRLQEIRDQNRGYYAADKVTLFRLLLEGDIHVAGETLYFHRDVVPHVSDIDGATRDGTPRNARVRSLLESIRDVHGYHVDLRALVRASQLAPRQRAALVRVSMRRELRAHPDRAWSALARQLRRARHETPRHHEQP